MNATKSDFGSHTTTPGFRFLDVEMTALNLAAFALAAFCMVAV